MTFWQSFLTFTLIIPANAAVPQLSPSSFPSDSGCRSADMGAQMGCCLPIMWDNIFGGNFPTVSTPTTAIDLLMSYMNGMPSSWGNLLPTEASWSTDMLACSRIGGMKGALAAIQKEILGFDKDLVMNTLTVDGSEICRVPLVLAVFGPLWNNKYDNIPYGDIPFLMGPPGNFNYENGTFFKDFLIPLLGPHRCGKCSLPDSAFATADISAAVSACQTGDVSNCGAAIRAVLQTLGVPDKEAFECFDLLLMALYLDGVPLANIKQTCGQYDWGQNLVSSAECVFRYTAADAKNVICYHDYQWIPSPDSVFGDTATPGMLLTWENPNFEWWKTPDGSCPSHAAVNAYAPPELNCGPAPFIWPCSTSSDCESDDHICFDGICVCDLLPGWTGPDAPFYGTGCPSEEPLMLFAKKVGCPIRSSLNTLCIIFFSIDIGVFSLGILVGFYVLFYVCKTAKNLYSSPFGPGAVWYACVFELLSLPFYLVYVLIVTLGAQGLSDWKNMRSHATYNGAMWGVATILESIALEFIIFMFVSMFRAAQGHQSTGVARALFVAQGLISAIVLASLMWYYHESVVFANTMVSLMVLCSWLTVQAIYCLFQFRILIQAAKTSPKLVSALKTVLPICVMMLFCLPGRVAFMAVMYVAAVNQMNHVPQWALGCYFLLVGIGSFIILSFAQKAMAVNLEVKSSSSSSSSSSS